jgi:hypothetical protein
VHSTIRDRDVRVLRLNPGVAPTHLWSGLCVRLPFRYAAGPRFLECASRWTSRTAGRWSETEHCRPGPMKSAHRWLGQVLLDMPHQFEAGLGDVAAIDQVRLQWLQVDVEWLFAEDPR